MDLVYAGVVGRSAEFRAIADFVAAANDQPAGLLVEGEAGIGKTTLWLAALEQARARGFHALSARAWEAESVLAYGTVADLLGDVDAEVLAGLPDVQRVAVDRVLLRDISGGPLTDQQVVAAALMTIVDTLAGEAHVSVGEYERALADLRPLISNFDSLRCMEIIKAGFIPDAVEAMVALGRVDEAEPMVAALERDGRRLDRTWMLATGGRCRGMMLAAQGDVVAAETAVRQAMAELAASGLTNRDVAAKLFVSTKTVEANLSQVYRKLGIRSRAELGRLMSQ